MELIIAKTAGFCFGVNRAVEAVHNNISIKNLYTYGPIIHNNQVVQELKEKGVNIIEDLDSLKEGTVIIRSHGVPKSVYTKLDEGHIDYIDATCPYVKRIHNIVSKHYKEGYHIVIIGNPNHPEVIGIRGWCNDKATIIDSVEAARNAKISVDEKICVVSQTTFDQYKFNNIIEVLKDLRYNLYVFSTICSSTYERQVEALEISRQVDKMIVIGGKHSSNTGKLYGICKENCRNTYHIETINDLPINDFNAFDKIGITAGASTPKNIIEEVIHTMSEIQNENLSFEELLNQSLVQLHSGEIVKGTVIQVSQNEVIVNVGYKSDGTITKSEYTNDPNADLSELVKVGEEIEVQVIRVNDKEGQLLLSRKKMLLQKGFDFIKSAYENQEVVKGVVNHKVKGGVVVILNEVKVFIPASQIDVRYIDDLSEFVGKEIEFRISEYNSRKGRIIGNRRALLEEVLNEKKQKALDKLEVGKKVVGIVKRITNFGAFVDLDGVDGLLHISEMSWRRVNKPQEILNIDDEIVVLIKEFDKEKSRISLTLKFPEQNPWADAEEKYKVGTVLEGKVVRLTSYGAFVEIVPGVDALLHVSQIAKKHVEKPSDELTVGDTITAKVIDFNNEGRKISLSIRAIEEEAEAEKAPEVEENEEVKETEETVEA